MAEAQRSEAVAATIGAYRAVGVAPEAVAFARAVVAAAEVAGPARARSLLWACSRLGAWALEVGLAPAPEVLLHPSTIERYLTVGMGERTEASRRTARANLRFVARRVVPRLPHPPEPLGLRRNRAKAPYSPAEVEGWLRLAAAQPTAARRHQLSALLCLGLGAGLERGELRGVRGGHVTCRSGGVVVEVMSGRRRVVPVLADYHGPLLDAAAHAGDRFVCGGRSPTRRNLTNDLVSRACGGSDLGRLDVGRLRATWLATHLSRLGLRALLQAAGVVCTQRLGDLAARLPALSEAELVEVLG